MSNLWTVNTGHDLGTYQESITQTILLPVNEVDSLTIISGQIPGGLRIETNDRLVGTPYEVKSLKVLVLPAHLLQHDVGRLVEFPSCAQVSQVCRTLHQG